jgi:hypothetical protein
MRMRADQTCTSEEAPHQMEFTVQLYFIIVHNVLSQLHSFRSLSRPPVRRMRVSTPDLHQTPQPLAKVPLPLPCRPAAPPSTRARGVSSTRARPRATGSVRPPCTCRSSAAPAACGRASARAPSGRCVHVHCSLRSCVAQAAGLRRHLVLHAVRVAAALRAR